jgi:hypothetical protein
MTEDAAIRIDLNSVERVYLYPTRDGTRRWSPNRAHPTVRTLGSYGPILHSALKTIPPAEGIAPELWNAPVWPHGRCTERVVSLPPLPHWYPLSWQVWFCTYQAQLGPNPTLGEVVCTKRSSEKVCPLAFRPGRAHVLQMSVKPQHPCSKNRTSGDTLRSAPHPRSQIGCFELTPVKVPKTPSPASFYPTHTKNHYSHPNTCIAKLSVYTCLYI